jgi:hypothetical protein
MLTMRIRKRAGVSNLMDSNSGSGVGMTAPMKERVKEALAGRTGETDDED